MSSSSSLCSSQEADYRGDSRLPPSLRHDVERFSVFANRLRHSLDPSANVADGESQCVQVHAALEMVSESMRDLFKHAQFKTNQVILPSLQLVQSVKELKFDSCLVDTSHVLSIVDQLETAVLNTIISQHVPSRGFHSATVGRRMKQQCSEEVYQPPVTPRSTSLQRRHSAAFQHNPRALSQEKDVAVMECDKSLCDRPDGVEIAFERTKAWSRYAKELLTYVKARSALEAEHAKKIQQLVEATRPAMSEAHMPLHDVFAKSFDVEADFVEDTRQANEKMNDRVIKALDARRIDHDNQRRAMKNEWSKQIKAMQDCESEYRKAKQALLAREDGLKKARDMSRRSEDASNDPMRRMKEQEKRRKQEDEAQTKREDAQRQVSILEAELRRRKKTVEQTKISTVERLRELIYQCDQTTKASASHYFKSLSSLWVPLPHKYDQLAEETREYEPGSEYMSYLHHLPPRAASTGSLLKRDGGGSVDEWGEGGAVFGRRNALDPSDHGTLPDTRRHKKTSSAGRLFETSELSEAALSHCVQRTVQPSKCSQCDTLSLLYTVQCLDCGGVWHKNCFPKISNRCGQPAKCADRRMSIFGVPLQGHLDTEQRAVPFILEATIHHVQMRGMRVKGIYRTCGVKSKIEEICEMFERGTGEVNLDHVHPMNLASVVKLYLRKLPQPVMTHQLYAEWLRFGQSCPADLPATLSEARRLLSALPRPNHDTLRLLMLHLNRVTWFAECNLMTSSNLAVVVGPSLLWPAPAQQPTAGAAGTPDIQYIRDSNHLNAAVDFLVRNAFTLFDTDRAADWTVFFQKYDMEEPSCEKVNEDDEDVLSDEEVCKEDEGYLEDDESLFAPQPATPDLLKNTKNTDCSSVESSSRPGWTTSDNSDDAATPKMEKSRPRREKRRSYTTSIIISPLNDRRPEIGSKQKSMDEQTTLRHIITADDSDITLDISKGQFFSDRTPRREGKAIQRRQSNKEYGSARPDYGSSGYSTDCARHAEPIISIHNVGDLFPGTDGDVSYV